MTEKESIEAAREPLDGLRLLLKDVREAKVTTNIPKVSGPVSDALAHIADRLEWEITALDSFAAKRERIARLEALEEAHNFSVHKGMCKAYPAFSEEQLLRDCDCGYVALFGWSSDNQKAIRALLEKEKG